MGSSATVMETGRLLLRQQTVEDAPFILGLLNDPEWVRHIGDRGVRSLDQARAYIRDGALAMYRRHGFGLYLVETRAGREPVGICGLIRRDFLPDVDLGFALAPGHRGRGYAREAALATMEQARAVHGLRRLAAIVSPGNAASIRLLEGLGFGFQRPFRYPDGDLVHLYGITLVDAGERS